MSRLLHAAGASFVLALSATVIVPCVYGSPASSSEGAPTAQTAAAAAPPAEAVTIYKAQCALCHGPTGTGSDVGKALKAKDLTSKGVQSETDDTLKHVITAGVGSMPAFGTKLTPEQIDGMVKMVRSLAADKPAGAPAK